LDISEYYLTQRYEKLGKSERDVCGLKKRIKKGVDFYRVEGQKISYMKRGGGGVTEFNQFRG